MTSKTTRNYDKVIKCFFGLTAGTSIIILLLIFLYLLKTLALAISMARILSKKYEYGNLYTFLKVYRLLF